MISLRRNYGFNDTLPILNMVFCLFFSFNFVYGQCDFNKISAGMNLYEFGKFEDAKQIILPCLLSKSFKEPNDNNKALRLLSLIAIAEDSLIMAEEYIKSIILNDPKFTSDPHLIFDPLFKKILEPLQTVKVYSVSKNAENIQTAPAPVILITREEIINRGYVDLVDVLADLPGFEISKIFSATYANIFQLGFRQENTERTLLMIDGIEENDIWSNIAYISRQYPLSNIKTIEVLYGPSSTMYGPRAFVGAINILTYGAGERPNSSFEKNNIEKQNKSLIFANGNLSRGTFNTNDFDLTMGYSGRNVKISVTSRFFTSDEDDLSFIDFYDYSVNDIDNLKYGSLNLKNNFTISNINGQKKTIPLNDYIKIFNLSENSNLYKIYRNSNQQVDSIILSPYGREYARNLDKKLYSGMVNGYPNGFSNHTKDYFISGKISFNHFEVGISTWKNEEGFNFYQDLYSPGSRNGSLWVPVNTTLFTKYTQEFNKFSVTNLTTFHDHGVNKASNRPNLNAFGIASGGLHLAHLLNPDSLIINNTGNALTQHGYNNYFFYYQAKQLRNDFRVIYQGEKLNLSSGLEFRSSLMQGDYLNYSNFDYKDKIDQKDISFAQELGTVRNQERGSNLYTIIDFGLYSQASIPLIPRKLIFHNGIRYDYNQIRSNGGFGSGLSPRSVLVLNLNEFTIKAIYSKGLQNVSQWTKFSTGGGRTPNPDLNTEKISFYNLSISNSLFKKQIIWDITAYNSFIKDAVASSTIAGITQNRNIGSYNIAGIMTSVKYVSKNGRYKAYLNHTFMAPYQVEDGINTNFQSLRIGDIATHHYNSGMDISIPSKKILYTLNLRTNYVGARKVGPGTTQSANRGIPDNQTNAYMVFNGNINICFLQYPWLRLSIIGNNILNDNILDSTDTRFYHPGPRSASGSETNISGNVPYIPQRPRYILFKINFNF
jgi:outer membrane receptor for ferrienterochelin and colicins